MAAQSDLSRATVERYLDLLNLDETMTGWAERGEMTMTDAYEMARRKNVHLQAAVEEYVAHNNANGDFPALSTGPSPGRRPPSRPPPPPSPPRPPILCGRWIPWPGRPPFHRPAESAGSLRRRGPHHRPEEAGHLPCQSGRTAANGGGPESRSGRLIPPLPRAVRAAQTPIENNGNGSHTRPVTVILAVFPSIRQIICLVRQSEFDVTLYRIQ